MDRGKILIVEDSASQAAAIAAMVTQLGYQSAVYSRLPSGIEAILQQEEPNLVLLDLMLLDDQGKQIADGFQVCREIKRWSAEIPVIVMTAEAEIDAAEWSALQGADAFLPKPFSDLELSQTISLVLGGINPQ